MIILRNKNFSDKKEKAATVGTLAAGGGVLSRVKSGRLTGKVIRYHDAPLEAIDKIKKEGIKSSHATDPNNITWEKVLKDIPGGQEAGKDLVYTAKKKRTAYLVGSSKADINGKLKTGKDKARELLGLVTGKSRHHKTLKLEFDYDELKGKTPIENPELRGAKNAEEFYNKYHKDKDIYKRTKDGKLVESRWNNASRGDKRWAKNYVDTYGAKGTHIFKGDIDPSHIVGGQGYKKRTLKQIGKYIKNNPKRFGKEAAKVATGLALVGTGATLARKNKNKIGRMVFK